MERDTDLEKIVDKYGHVISRGVYSVYDVLIAGLYWQESPNREWHVERVLQWMKDNPGAHEWPSSHPPDPSPSPSKDQ